MKNTTMIKAADLKRGMRLSLGVYGDSYLITRVKADSAAYIQVELEDGRTLSIRNNRYRADVEIAR